MTEPPLTDDRFLDGRLNILQPKDGYRAGVDPVLLAAAVPARAGETVLELGCGVGVASLCLLSRVNGLLGTGIEMQTFYAKLACRNAERAGLPLDVVTADLRELPPAIRARSFHHVMMNPPYFDRAASTPSQDQGRDIALGGETAMADWIDAAARRLRPKGTLTVIQRIERLPEIIGLVAVRLGSIVIRPVAAREGRAAGLFLLQARKSGRAKFHLSPPLILHEGAAHLRDGDDYAPEIREILRNGGALEMKSD